MHIVTKLRQMLKAATSRPWRQARTPDVRNVWFDALPYDATPIESTGTVFACGVAVGGMARAEDAALVTEVINALPELLDRVKALNDARADLAAVATASGLPPDTTAVKVVAKVARLQNAARNYLKCLRAHRRHMGAWETEHLNNAITELIAAVFGKGQE